MPNSERNTEICRLYAEGLTLQECAVRFKLSHERVRQILRKHVEERAQELVRTNPGLSLEKARIQAEVACRWRHDQAKKADVRDEFLGVNVREATKDALREMAVDAGKSMSQLASDKLDELVAPKLAEKIAE